MWTVAGKSTALPCCSAGLKRICCAARMAASSSPCPSPLVTRTTRTPPDAGKTTSISTSPSRPRRRASSRVHRIRLFEDDDGLNRRDRRDLFGPRRFRADFRLGKASSAHFSAGRRSARLDGHAITETAAGHGSALALRSAGAVAVAGAGRQSWRAQASNRRRAIGIRFSGQTTLVAEAAGLNLGDVGWLGDGDRRQRFLCLSIQSSRARAGVPALCCCSQALLR